MARRSSQQPSYSFSTLKKEKRKNGNENHLARLLGKFIVVSLLTRKCYVVCHLTNLLCNKCHAKKHDKMEPLLIAIFVKSNIDFNVVLYSVLHLKHRLLTTSFAKNVRMALQHCGGIPKIRKHFIAFHDHDQFCHK